MGLRTCFMRLSWKGNALHTVWVLNKWQFLKEKQKDKTRQRGRCLGAHSAQTPCYCPSQSFHLHSRFDLSSCLHKQSDSHILKLECQTSTAGHCHLLPEPVTQFKAPWPWVASDAVVRQPQGGWSEGARWRSRVVCSVPCWLRQLQGRLWNQHLPRLYVPLFDMQGPGCLRVVAV